MNLYVVQTLGFFTAAKILFSKDGVYCMQLNNGLLCSVIRRFSVQTLTPLCPFYKDIARTRMSAIDMCNSFLSDPVLLVLQVGCNFYGCFITTSARQIVCR